MKSTVILDIGSDLLGFLLVVGILGIVAYGWFVKGVECNLNLHAPVTFALFGAAGLSLKSLISGAAKWVALLK